jgi:uncharacterized membrane protein YbhN (UPF0104 family)
MLVVIQLGSERCANSVLPAMISRSSARRPAKILFLGLTNYSLSFLQIMLVTAGALALVVGIALFAPTLLRIGGVKLKQRRPRFIFDLFLRAYCYYVLFFVITGGLLAVLVYVCADSIDINLVMHVLVSYSAAWLVGYITPGAPGGGVRDAMLVILLSRVITQPQAILVALLFRIVTVSGDILYFYLASLSAPALQDQGATDRNDCVL